MEFSLGRWLGQVPGVLPSGERSVAQPDSEGAPGPVRCSERAEESGRRSRHHTVQSCDPLVSRGRKAVH